MAIDTPARIAVLGAGPIGLETALYARYLGYDVDVYERGRVAENVLRWGHARMYTPFETNRSPLGLAALKAQDPNWQAPPDEVFLLGREFAEGYLLPLSRSDLLADSLHEQTEVLAVGRHPAISGETSEEEAHAEGEFRILLRDTSAGVHGRERIATADAVIDTSGTYGNSNGLAAGGIPAIGELAAAPHIEYGLPDVRGAARDHYASRNILLVGSNFLAAANVLALAELASQAPDTWVTWITQSASDENSALCVDCTRDDPFGHRAQLCEDANRLARDGGNHVTCFNRTHVEALSWHADLARFSVRLSGKHAGEMEFDRIIANVGFRPDNGIYGPLQINPSVAAGSSDEDAPSSQLGSLVSHEADFYILGAKSHCRDSEFLIAMGLEQIRQIFAIIGDRADLDLYATMAGLY